MNESILEKTLALRNGFNTVIARHNDDEGFVNAVNAILEENEFVSVEKIQEDYTRNADSERILKIGIVGAVKAGKSSLLNALFFDGNDILPKAATPMTAALTEISYGEQCKVTVDFFTEKDIYILKEGHSRYISFIEKTKKEEYEKNKAAWMKAQKRRNPLSSVIPSKYDEKRWDEMAEKNAKRKANENLILYGAYDQYESIKSATAPRKTESESFTVEKIEQIAGRLEDYVGSKGKYMPFTSRVSIELPIEDLKGICVVDTPGFNDPVPSRNDRARKSLRECDVVLILSPARQFLSKNDMEIMSKITAKQGIRELYLIQSQIDNQLYDMEIVDETKGNLDMAIEKIVATLNATARNNLRNINETGVFDELINETENRTYPTSGICQSMAETFAERKSWDDGRKHIWGNLCEAYPDYFSDSDAETSRTSLLKLGNVGKIHDAIIVVKEKKSEIFAQRLADFEMKYQNACDSSKKCILEYIQNRQEELEKTDIKQVEKQIASLQNMYEAVAPDLDDALEDTVREWYDETKNDYSGFLMEMKGEAKSGVSNAQGSRTETKSRRGGFLWLFKKYYTVEYTTANVSAVKNSIYDYIDSYNDAIPHFMESQAYRLSKKVVVNVMKTWNNAQNNYGAEFQEENSLVKIRNKVRSIISEILSMNYDLAYKENPFENGSAFGSYSGESGTIEGWSAENLLEKARDFIRNFDSSTKAKLNGILDDILSKCKNFDFAEKVLDSYLSQLEKAKKDLEQPKLAVENFKRMKKEIEEI